MKRLRSKHWPYLEIEPLTSVKVGDLVDLLPDEMVERVHEEIEWYPNSTLELGEPPYTVRDIELEEGVLLIQVEGCFKQLRHLRFYLVRSVLRPRED
jgi:hypothetical protein